ncbi:non-hydrolyzing UDP-N-acetylglucosamine 2-epimerase [Methanoplanus limicola]|uniref:UDP-N-acetylglucosamine 2-epimerase n=1 Tax=Methanoplanus limicola DSM 2279 TaxID=937775 RepID=H1Z4F0_9EURY|nr:UDP-N-acetylglucosamine 2-epimerase (non-hydrolyzing) [Methanoplanus limicola]EHQ36698.1 UDP-N-acetylglucosamine 2-epimerase [Methanoplanus limicola DSM 2279]
MKIVSIVGARPQFIKCAPVSRELRKEHQEILVHTGQHYDANMSDIFFEQLSIPKPDYNLNIGSGSQGEQTGKMLIEIEKVLIKEQPDMVLVYGDTNSTLAGALAAAKLHIPIAHVEAGLRSFDRTMPEEINRIMTDHLSDLLFCPTQTAVDNLKNEGITKGVHLTGDVMVDALQYNLKIAEEKSTILERLNLIDDNSNKISKYYVATVHRPSNTDSKENLTNIIEAFIEIANSEDAQIIFPAHPRTVKCLREYGLYEIISNKNQYKPGKIVLIDPLPYLDMLLLMSNAKMIFTDSGGIQKEAYILNVPCVTLRDNTEWVETLQDGMNILTGAGKIKIILAILKYEQIKNNQVFNNLQNTGRFGNGDSSELIVSEISIFNKILGGCPRMVSQYDQLL